MIKVWDKGLEQVRFLHPIDAQEQLKAGLITLDIPGQEEKPQSPKIKKQELKKANGKPTTPKLIDETEKDKQEASQILKQDKNPEQEESTKPARRKKNKNVEEDK